MAPCERVLFFSYGKFTAQVKTKSVVFSHNLLRLQATRSIQILMSLSSCKKDLPSKDCLFKSVKMLLWDNNNTQRILSLLIWKPCSEKHLPIIWTES